MTLSLLLGMAVIKPNKIDYHYVVFNYQLLYKTPNKDQFNQVIIPFHQGRMQNSHSSSLKVSIFPNTAKTPSK